MTGTHDTRRICFHADNLKFDGAKALQSWIVRFVKGIRGERKVPVSEKQIVDWFRATDPAFVREQLDVVCADGRVRICQRSLSSRRRFNGAYVYEAA